MAVPRNRMSNSKKGMRRGHHALKAKTISTCSHCSGPKQPHRVCPNCGTYRGRELRPAAEAVE